MNGVFDILPPFCCVSRETYRALVERSAAVSDLGNLIIGTYAVTGIATDTAQLRIVIDEMLTGTRLSVE